MLIGFCDALHINHTGLRIDVRAIAHEFVIEFLFAMGVDLLSRIDFTCLFRYY